MAEAYNQTGSDPLALTHLNNARAAVPLPALVGITGVALLDSIMTEKYVTLFQNMETWNDYRRMCIPRLTPYNTGAVNPQWRGKIPGRLFYGGTEMNVNPNMYPVNAFKLEGWRNEILGIKSALEQEITRLKKFHRAIAASVRD